MAPGVKGRVLLAGLFHQTNTFVGGRSNLEDFQIRRGKQILGANDASPIAGVLEVAAFCDWELVPVPMQGHDLDAAIQDRPFAGLQKVPEAVRVRLAMLRRNDQGRK